MSTEIADISPEYIHGLREFPQDTASNNLLSCFEFKGNWYVRKELLPNSKYFTRGCSDPDMLAIWMGNTYKILRKYYYEDETWVPNTGYRVEIGQFGKPTVVTLQDEVFGPTLRQVDRRRLKYDPEAVLDSFQKKWEKVIKDPEWKKFPEDERKFFQEMNIDKDHIICEPGRYALVDW